jgi:hypothetical protein
VAARERGEKLLVKQLVVYKEDVFIFFSCSHFCCCSQSRE